MPATRSEVPLSPCELIPMSIPSFCVINSPPLFVHSTVESIATLTRPSLLLPFPLKLWDAELGGPEANGASLGLTPPPDRASNCSPQLPQVSSPGFGTRLSFPQ